MGEIAAAATLQDSLMTAREALQSITAIADWVFAEDPQAPVDCGDLIRCVSAMTDIDLDALDDDRAVRLFDAVLQMLKAPGTRGSHAP